MRSLLEQAFVELLNENNQKAQELFHKFIVERARQIHESNRAGEDYVLDENWNDEITTESYFTEDDLSDLEDDEAEDDFSDAEDDFEAGEEDMEAGEEELDGVDGEDMDDFDGEDGIDDFEEPEDGMEDGSTEDRMDQAVDRLEDMMAEFEAKMAEIDTMLGNDDGLDGDDLEGDDLDGLDGDVDDVGGEDMGDDFGSEEDGMDSDDDMGSMDDDMDDDDMDSEEDFDDISESIIDELEKIKVTMIDGSGVGTGSTDKPTQNKKSIGLQKNIQARQGGNPTVSKQKTHTGYARETAPAVKDIVVKKRSPNQTYKMDKMSKEGDPKAEVNKLGQRAGDKVSGSVIDGRNAKK